MLSTRTCHVRASAYSLIPYVSRCTNVGRRRAKVFNCSHLCLAHTKTPNPQPQLVRHQEEPKPKAKAKTTTRRPDRMAIELAEAGGDYVSHNVNSLRRVLQGIIQGRTSIGVIKGGLGV